PQPQYISPPQQDLSSSPYSALAPQLQAAPIPQAQPSNNSQPDPMCFPVCCCIQQIVCDALGMPTTVSHCQQVLIQIG
ncbi:unnamed protein product, partial [Adineta steineri]